MCKIEKDPPPMTMSKTIPILAMLVLTTLEARAEAPPASSPQTGSPAVLALESLADKGSARAQFELGKRLEFGIGIDRNLDRAAQFYCGAAEQGHGEAALHLGRFYLAGTGVPRDSGRAAAWLRVAAGQGLTEAGALLARAAAGADPRIPATCRPPRFTPIPIYAPAQIRRMVEKLAPRFGLDAKLVLSVIQTESAYRQDAVSPRNAMGLMQLIPETAARFGVENPFDAEQNLLGGMKYLRWLLAYYQGNVTLVAAAYNAGEGAVDRYRGVPPYPETQDYVERIRRTYARDTHPFQSRIVTASAMLANREVAELE